MKHRILLLEDNDFIRENTVEILELSDYEVVAVPDGARGLAIFDARTPDLILCDIQMPRMNGYDFFKAIRKNEKAASIPFVFLTAFSEKKEIISALEMGATDYIVKPFDADELVRLIKKHLTR